MNLFNNIFVLFFLSFCVSSSGVNIDGFQFESQVSVDKDFISVWLYKISREEIKEFAKYSKFNFHTKNDVVVLLQMLYLQLKSQGIQHQYVGRINSQLLLQIEGMFSAYADENNLTLVPDSKVVKVYQYIVDKSDANAAAKINTLRSRVIQDFNLMISLFSNVGEISVALLGEKVKKGQFLVMEDSDSFYCLIVMSNPYKKKKMSNVKTAVKNYISYFLNGHCIYIEN